MGVALQVATSISGPWRVKSCDQCLDCEGPLVRPGFLAPAIFLSDGQGSNQRRVQHTAIPWSYKTAFENTTLAMLCSDVNDLVA